LTATPKCIMPDYYLDTAIKIGLFNYIFVQFYNNPSCQYDQANADATLLFQSWDAWTSLATYYVFWGLPTSLYHQMISFLMFFLTLTKLVIPVSVEDL
jgi:chitinase